VTGWKTKTGFGVFILRERLRVIIGYKLHSSQNAQFNYVRYSLLLLRLISIICENYIAKTIGGVWYRITNQSMSSQTELMQ
jgi:hypothetical protein